jgi:hypothetical protein
LGLVTERVFVAVSSALGKVFAFEELLTLGLVVLR